MPNQATGMPWREQVKSVGGLNTRDNQKDFSCLSVCLIDVMRVCLGVKKIRSIAIYRWNQINADGWNQITMREHTVLCSGKWLS